MENLFGRPVPRLGFGCMRLPEGQDGEYIEEECQEMFDYAMTHGLNYFDSAWHYIDSQKMIGQCLAKYPRENYMLVGKLCFTDGTLETREMALEAFEKELFDAADPNQSPAEWALRYAASLDGVVTVLSGMSTIEQMKENCRILLDDFKPVTEEEKEMLAKAAKIIEGKRPVGCTGCHYCTDKGCPAGIQIPEILNCLNLLNQYHNPRMARMSYYPAISEHSPRECLHCGSCERECPQHLKITELIKEADEKLYMGENYDIWANHD